MSRELGAEPLEESELRLVVGLRDGRQVGLAHDADVGPEVAERDRAGGADRVRAASRTRSVTSAAAPGPDRR